MEMWLQPPLSSLYPPLSETAGENNVENNTNLFSVRLNIRFEFSAVREPSQRGGGSPLSCFLSGRRIPVFTGIYYGIGAV